MSHIRVKTKYNVEGSYGTIEERVLYSHHNNSCDVVTYYDENGKVLFCVEDTTQNNLLDAINRLYVPQKLTGNELYEGIEYMDLQDCEKCNI